MATRQSAVGTRLTRNSFVYPKGKEREGPEGGEYIIHGLCPLRRTRYSTALRISRTLITYSDTDNNTDTTSTPENIYLLPVRSNTPTYLYGFARSRNGPPPLGGQHHTPPGPRYLVLGSRATQVQFSRYIRSSSRGSWAVPAANVPGAPGQYPQGPRICLQGDGSG